MIALNIFFFFFCNSPKFSDKLSGHFSFLMQQMNKKVDKIGRRVFLESGRHESKKLSQPK